MNKEGSSEDAHFHLDPSEPSGVRKFLVRRGFLESQDELTMEVAGEGNMNCVLRVQTPKRSLIVKQARPWVEKYPTIAAPIERASMEARFYQTVMLDPGLAAGMPSLLGFEAEARVLILEDLSPAESLMGCYKDGFPFGADSLEFLAGWLGRLHGFMLPSEEWSGFSNLAMRQLNHEHIFDLPLRRQSGLREMLEGVTPGLDEAGAVLRSDERYCEHVRALGQRYLGADGNALLHGDFFPGSLLRQESGALKIIDPEFCFRGDSEFDWGVFLAHLQLSGQGEETAERWVEAALSGGRKDEKLLRQYAGVEMMRRLLGVAQLPLAHSLEEKQRLLHLSRKWVLG